MDSPSIALSVDSFGSVNDPITNKESEVKRFTWINSKSNVSVQMISYGAMLTSVKVPSKNGDLRDVCLGFDNIEGYLKDRNSAYIGSLMGRVANRIGNGEFNLNGQTYKLAQNFLGKHSLHGGIIGFDKFNWDSYVEGTTVYLTHVSPDTFEGYPGTVLVTVECRLSEDDEFAMNVSAVSNKPTIINMSNHSYFNLAGHDKGYQELYKHKMTMNSDRILKISPEQIPTGEFLDVGDTEFDFRLPQSLGVAISKTTGNGFDHSFCITSTGATHPPAMRFVARVIHPDSGRTMEVYSDQASVLFYSSNNLPDPCGNISPSLSEDSCEKSSNVVGKGGAFYKKHGAFCLETQNYADAIHHKNFPSIVLNPGKVYRHETIYKFGVFSN